nr:reverse transcriptase domain-containing protein [Tanacetum cinerariifolium]
MDKDETVPIHLERPFLATAHAVIDVHEGKLILRVGNEIFTFNIGEFMRVAYSRDDYLYRADHTANLVQEKWVDTLIHDRKWTEIEEEIDSEEDQEKTTFTCPYGTFAYKRMPFGLWNTLATFQCCMMAIFNELIEDIMEVFMDEFSVFEHSFDHCLANLEKMLKRCEETNLVLNLEKYHFMVKEGIVLGHKVFGSRIEVDKTKIDSISKLPYPTNVNAIRSFLVHAGFYRRFIKVFSKIARPMTQLLVKDSPFIFSDECIQAFDKLKQELTQAPIMIKPYWLLPFEIMCDASDYAIGTVSGQRRDKHF